jgi:hypothetical protein
MILTPSEQTTLLLLADELKNTRDAEKYLQAVNRVVLNKLAEKSETERLLRIR